MYYMITWKRRQPTFDLGWWSRGQFLKCPNRWPQLRRTTAKTLEKVHWVMSTHSAPKPEA
ncbi:hypothetical protein ACFXAW_06815 [Streptomyces sp. NPDC059445]|uniref:hypothetical protein n=1 Tax=Streptomyces sp. NPDC059445 TaxID=3346832 RepID=UPI0036938994